MKPTDSLSGMTLVEKVKGGNGAHSESELKAIFKGKQSEYKKLVA